MVWITRRDLAERYCTNIYEFRNPELLLSAASNMIPELKHRFPDQWLEILTISMIRAKDPRSIKLMMSV